MKKKLFIVFAIVLVLIQFYRPAKNQNPEISTADISKISNVPENVLQILKTACYDCHSNNTIYPWYASIQPVAWWLQRHVDEGKKRLNFSEFGNYSAEKAAKKLKQTAEVIEEEEMPLFSYTIIHRNAILNAEQKSIVLNWLQSHNTNKK